MCGQTVKLKHWVYKGFTSGIFTPGDNPKQYQDCSDPVVQITINNNENKIKKTLNYWH